MVLNLDEKRFLFLFPPIQYRQLLGNIKMSMVKIAITASSTSKGQRERESKKISCNCFNARLDRESCYSSFRLSSSRAPDFELVLILSPLLPTCMYIHFGCSSLKPGHVTFLNNFPFLDIILPIKKQNLSLLSRSHIPVLFLLLNPIWKYLCTFQVVFNGRVICQEKMLIFNASIS